MTVEGANKVSGGNPLVICSAQTNLALEDKFEVPLSRNYVKLKKIRLGRIMPELYNLENGIEPEKPVKIDLDLDLYQMENF
jgi:hypothetical protein